MMYPFKRKLESIGSITLLAVTGTIFAGVILFSVNNWNAIQDSFRKMDETYIPVLSNISSAALDISRMRTEMFRYINDYEPAPYLILEHFEKAEEKFAKIDINELPENSRQLFQNLRLQMSHYGEMVSAIEKYVDENNSVKTAELNNKVAGVGTTLSFIAERIGENIWQTTIRVNKESKETLIRNTTILFFISVSVVILLFLGILYQNSSLQRLVEKRTDELRIQLKDLHRAEKALRKSEKRYTNLTDILNIGVFRSEAKAGGRLLEVNPAMVEIFHYDSIEDILNREMSSFYAHPHQRQALLEKIKTQGYLKNQEVELKAKDGTHLFASVSIIWLGDQDTGENYISGFIEDISEKKALEKQILQSQKMESIGTLTGGIAHDFNNILSIMIGNTELALDKITEESNRAECLGEVIKAGLRAKGVIKQLLSFSRKEQQEQELVNLGKILGESLQLLRASIPTTIEINKRVEKNLKTISVDSTQIQLVIINLCNNAVQAMPNGGTLKLEVENFNLTDNTSFYDLEPGHYVKLSIKDTGEGIKEENLERVFEPYFTTKDIGKGTGLGLAMVHGIIANHDGIINVQSEVGSGSQFEIYFPAFNIDAKPVERNEVAIQKGHERILIVDDEDALLAFCDKFLRRLGYMVTSKNSAIEALRLFKADPNSFDLIITDMTMPKMDGLQLVLAVQEIRSDIPVILSTGYSEKIDEIKALDVGIKVFLEKPIETAIYASTIRKILDLE